MSKKINNNLIEQESGRSMVEMLGVLAIIGVLSVGGISGYTTAMNKHKANEILNAAAIRAMAVSAQIQSGVDPSTATGSVIPEDVGTAQIGSASPVGTEQFKLVFTNNVDEAICNQMKNIAGENSAVSVSCDRLLYNNDMSNGVENKNIESVGEGGVYTCKTGFDPASKCESCLKGFGGLACNTCADGYTGDNCNTCASGATEMDDGTCCPAGKVAHWGPYNTYACCGENEYVSNDPWGNGSICCPNPANVVFMPDWATYFPTCCPADKYSQNPMNPDYEACCTENEYVKMAQNDSALHVCCPNRTDIAFADLDNYKMKCCPSTSTGLVNGECN